MGFLVTLANVGDKVVCSQECVRLIAIRPGRELIEILDVVDFNARTMKSCSNCGRRFSG